MAARGENLYKYKYSFTKQTQELGGDKEALAPNGYNLHAFLEQYSIVYCRKSNILSF